MSSSNAFNLINANILLSGKGLSFHILAEWLVPGTIRLYPFVLTLSQTSPGFYLSAVHVF